MTNEQEIIEPTVGGFSVSEQKKLLQLGRYSLIDFSILTNRNYRPNFHHRVIAEELEKVLTNTANWKILILMMPPRHGKSQLASINFPAYFLGRCPDRQIITTSYGAELAISFGSKTRDLVGSLEYSLIFPEVSLKEDEQSKAKWRTTQGGSYLSTGIGGSITGYGANILIIDDPLKNREDAESKIIRDKQWDWFQSVAYTRLEPNGRIVLILTRWHLDDLAGRIIQHSEFSLKTKIISFPAIAIEDETYRKKGVVLWAERYDLKEMESIKNSIGISNFVSLYQQRPILSENQEFKQHWFVYREWQDVLVIQTRNFLTVDTAISKKASADFTGIVSNFVDKENKWNIKVKRLKIDPKELIDLLFNLQAQDGYEKIGIEKTIYFDCIKPFLDDEQRKRNKFLNIVPLEHHQTNKETRIRGLIPRYESKSIIHIKDECTDLEEEILTFPKGIYDDCLDALAYQVQIAEAPTIDEEEQRQRISEQERESLVHELL